MNLRRSLVSVPAVLAILVGGLTACSSAGDTTCGDFKDSSDSEKLDLLEQAADEEGGDGEKEWDALGDEEKQLVVEFLVTACNSADDDTKLEDLE